jgi:hypothetical protein
MLLFELAKQQLCSNLVPKRELGNQKVKPLPMQTKAWCQIANLFG